MRSMRHRTARAVKRIMAMACWSVAAGLWWPGITWANCDNCLIGPVELTAAKGKPVEFREEFAAEAAGKYDLTAANLGGKPLALQVRLNGESIVHGPLLSTKRSRSPSTSVTRT